MFAGIEGRGTEFHCAVGSGAGEIVASARFPATTPEQTLGSVTDFLIRQQDHCGQITSAGIACFGPLDLRQGLITFTLKPGWQGHRVVDAVRDALGVPVVLDTDVNAAAVAEATSRGVRSLLFVTLGTGTGIGAGAFADGRPVHGLSHPEMGHLSMVRHPSDPMPGRCPYHGDCLEGLATNAAMTQRWGVELAGMPSRAIELEAWYLAQLATAAIYMLSPELIVIDGAAAGLPGMIAAVRAATKARLGDDPAVRSITAGIDGYIQASALDGRAALLGALALAASIDGVQDG